MPLNYGVDWEAFIGATGTKIEEVPVVPFPSAPNSSN